MKLTIIARSRDDFDVIVNSEELHAFLQSVLNTASDGKGSRDACSENIASSRFDAGHS